MSPFIEALVPVTTPADGATRYTVGTPSLRRFLIRAENPPYTFLFVGLSVSLWFLSSFLLGLSHVGQIDLGELSLAWSDLHLQGVLLGLIIGVGGRLIPGILGWEEIVAAQRKKYEKPIPFTKVIPISTMVLALLFFGSYFLQAHFWELALWLRFIVVLYVGIRMWRMHRLPPKRTRLSLGIWATTWFFVFSAVIPLVWVHAYSHSAHSYFISGFSLLTLLIATRVTLAHAGSDFTLESKSKMIPMVVGLMLVAASTRITAIFWPKSYLHHLGYSSLLWILAVLIWGMVMVPKILLCKSPESPKPEARS